MATKKWQYDDSKSLNDNVWDALIAASKYFGQTKMRQYKNVPGMTFQDIDHEILVRAYPNMVEKIDGGWREEHPDLTLWNLAFGCVWSSWSNVCHQFTEKYGFQQLNTSSLETPIRDAEGLTLQDAIPAGTRLNYKPSYNYDDRVEPTGDIMDYLESCMEYNLEPDPEVVEGMLFRLRAIPAPDEIPGFENMVKLMRTAKYRVTTCRSGRDWKVEYAKMKNEPPKEFAYLVNDPAGHRKVLHKEPNPAYRPDQAQPGRLPAAEGPQGTS